MKRIYLAAILLAFSAFVCVTEFVYINSCADKISQQIQDVYHTYEAGYKDKAIFYAEKVKEEWENNVRRIDMLLYHDYVDDVTRNIVNLKTYIEQEDAVGLYSTCNQVMAQIKSIQNSEYPTLENII